MLIVTDKSGNGMGIGFVSRGKVTGALTGIGYSDSTTILGEFNASLKGTFNASLKLVRSFDNGATWNPLTALGQEYEFTAPCEETFDEGEPGVLYAWHCIEYNSGTIQYRISQ